MRGGLIIKAARNARGYTQIELSVQYGIAVNTLSNYEREITEPSFLQVYEILNFLGFDITEIYDFVNDRDIPDNKGSQKRVA